VGLALEYQNTPLLVFHVFRLLTRVKIVVPSEIKEHKPDCRNKAEGLVAIMRRLETPILAVSWDRLVRRAHKTNIVLQRTDMDLNTATALLESLVEFLRETREKYSDMEEHGIKLEGTNLYRDEHCRIRKLKRKYDTAKSVSEALLTPAEAFKTSIFILIDDTLKEVPRKRREAYKTVCTRFGFLRVLTKLSSEILREAASNFVSCYPYNLEAALADKLVQFAALLNVILHKQKANLDRSDRKCIEVRMYLFIVENELHSAFPNTEIALRINLCFMVSNCTGERSFSKLRRIKN